MNDQLLVDFKLLSLNIFNSKNIQNYEFEKFYLTNFNYQNINLIDHIDSSILKIYIYNSITNEKVFYDESDYCLFVIKNKIMIAFANYKNFTPKTHLYVEYNNIVELIQITLFEDIERFLYMGKDHEWGGFVFLNSKIVEKSMINENRIRCDLNDYGPLYWTQDGGEPNEPKYSFLNSSFDITSLKEFVIFMSVPGCGHITYIRLKPNNGKTWFNDFINNLELPTTSATLFELFKLITEWASVIDPPWNNNQTIAKKAKLFIEGLNIPDDIKTIIENEQTDMQIYRYLKNNPEARNRPDVAEIKKMPDLMMNWLKSQFCYRNFENLIMYHPHFYGDV